MPPDISADALLTPSSPPQHNQRSYFDVAAFDAIFLHITYYFTLMLLMLHRAYMRLCARRCRARCTCCHAAMALRARGVVADILRRYYSREARAKARAPMMLIISPTPLPIRLLALRHLTPALRRCLYADISFFLADIMSFADIRRHISRRRRCHAVFDD